ncbi:hypothetical protein [Halotia branconii]|uniref:Uncharacterized protein n=1 Tax=Halotia branconii CENA392 TaxID=1539056 RepID=A0AAJ6NVW9_9CYAN|nr:hypothetical protein [Halotia branconii]WGV27378.1 hypothetical protein QI031_07790 [Halotia branconii CENA392]
MKFNLLSIATTFFSVLASNVLLASGASAQVTEVYSPGASTGSVTDIKYYTTPYLNAAPGSYYYQTYTCPSGYVVGGGFQTSGNLVGNDGLTLIASYPSTTRQWTLRYKNTDNENRLVRMYLICLI